MPALRSVSTRRSILAVLICWLLVVSDGYDLIVYGMVQTSLIEDTGWGLTDATAGTLGSLAFFGMMIGAYLGGRIGDRFGRRRTIIACTVAFTLLNALCGLAADVWIFAVLRFLAGLGLGGLLPSLNALTGDLVTARWRPAMATFMMSGVPIGGTIAALMGTVVVPELGWRWMFILTLVSLVIVPMALKCLPETTGRRASSPDSVEQHEAAGAPLSIFDERRRSLSVLFAAATLAILFTWYGLGTWLPRMMELQGHDLGSALKFTVALNLGAVAGSAVTAWAGGRFGPLVSAAGAVLFAGVGMVIMIGGTTPTPLVYLLLLFAGVGTHGAQCLVIGAINNSYPQPIRGTALGWSLGVGRVGAVLAPQVGGLLVGTALGVAAVYLAFAATAFIAVAILLLLVSISRRVTQTPDQLQHTDSNILDPWPADPSPLDRPMESVPSTRR